MASTLDLGSAPRIFILPTHFEAEVLRGVEDEVSHCGGKLTSDAREAQVFLGKVGQKRRAMFDLRARGVWTEEFASPETRSTSTRTRKGGDRHVRKRRKVGGEVEERGADAESVSSRTASETEDGASDAEAPPSSSKDYWPDLSDSVLVLKLAWLETCIKNGTMVPFKPYLVYWGRIIAKPASNSSPNQGAKGGITYIKATPEGSSITGPSPSSPTRTRSGAMSILERAKLDAEASSQASSAYTSRRRFGDRGHQHKKSSSPVSPRSQRPKLHRTTTSELEDMAEHPLPPLPEWASGKNAAYACCRSTPTQTPNAAFIAQLTKIKDARLLTLDEIGVRAYSTSIATVAAYPHRVTRHQELTRLPGCHDKIALLWTEWHESADEDSQRHIETVERLDADEDLKVLSLFWNIWGVGPDTARKFYFEHGWKDLDDVVEFGWDSLTRVQQIGVKYYDEFLVKIPRKEVEEIHEVIVRHARLMLDVQENEHGTDRDVECIIVGGYRRGKEFCGDVDVILSHRDEAKTQDLVVDVVRSLETEGWVTHTLSLHTTTSDRGQATLPFRTQGRGHGFDSLDKALCVWQDPHFENASPDQKNPNIHRRVDIIISTWRTVGCAVLGWSGGTTFQRDIRRFVTKVHGWKFDSSGVRDRLSGRVLDLEAPRDVETDGVMVRDDKDTWSDRERRLMEGLGIGYRPATERCTG